MTVSSPAPPAAARRPVLAGIRPGAVLGGLTAADGLVVLSGAWAGGGLVVARDPVRASASVDEVFGAAEPWGADFGLGSAGGIGGGWFGWLPYPGDGAPDPWFGLYPNLVRYSEPDRAWFDEALPGILGDAELARRRRRAVALAAAAATRRGRGSYRLGGLRPNMSVARYTAAVERCVERIRAGDIYQANICLRLDATFTGDACALFADLVAALDPAYAALVCLRDTAVVSVSPELFLRRNGREVSSAPIKGTLPRTVGPRADAATDPQAARLARSAKDRAENVMIVDLVRNDLGRVAETGTVRVPSLLRVEPHCGVWHLVSRVAATLPEQTGDDRLLAATFPPGSVTGAPKLAALEVIDELETAPRGMYTGAVGYRSPTGGLELNVAIRTITVDRSTSRASLGVGAGITAESTPILEWRECLAKAMPLAEATRTRLHHAPQPPERTDGPVHETMLVLAGRVVDIDAHLRRLRRSVDELWGIGLPDNVRDRVRSAAADTVLPVAALRLAVGPDPTGTCRIGLRLARALRPAPPSYQQGLRLRAVTVTDGAGEYKTARPALDALESRIGRGQVLLVDTEGRCLQASRGNLLVFRGRALVTPPLDGRVVPGLTRATVLDLARAAGLDVELREIELAELADADGVAVSGSLTGLEWVRHCPGRTWHAPTSTVVELSVALLARWEIR